MYYQKDKGLQMKHVKEKDNRLLSRQFVLLWQGQAVSKLGTYIFDLAMILWLMDKANSAVFIAIILIASNIPEIILSPFGGTLADIFSRRKILIYTDIISGFLVTSFSLILLFDLLPDSYNFIFLFLVSLGLGICSAFFNPTVSALIPDITDKNKLHSANSLIQSTGRIATIAGQGLGGILFTIFGGPLLFLINGISFIFSAISEFFLEKDKKQARINKDWKQNLLTFKSNFKDGFYYCWNEKKLRYFLLIIAFYHFFVSPLPILLPFYVSETLQLDNSWLGFLLAAFASGTLAGFTVVGIIKIEDRHIIKFVSFLLFVSSFLFLIMGLFSSVYLSLLCLVLIGSIVGIVLVTLITVMQKVTETDMRGRVFGFLNTITNATIPVGLALYGIIIDFLRVDLNLLAYASQIVFFINGSFIFIFMLIIFLKTKEKKLDLSESYNPI